MSTPINTDELRDKVKGMYREVATKPHGKYHFRMGRDLAEDLGYDPADLDKIPNEAMESFAGVGYHFGLAQIHEGEKVLDLGSGSGMDAFVAALKVGRSGKVIGVDMTDEQLEKARTLAEREGFDNVEFIKGYVEKLPFEDANFDVVISNGVINLVTEKEKVFDEIARVLKPGGRLAISDIVTEDPLKESIVANVDLWASCIGGAALKEKYRAAIEKAGMRVQVVQENSQYQFISDAAKGATEEYGVKSISLLAKKS